MERSVHPSMLALVAAGELDREQGPRWHLATASSWICRAVVALLFAYAALSKITDPSAFAEDIDHYRLLPDATIGPLALGLPVLELLVAVALLTGIHRGGAALVAMLMLVGFSLGMAQALVRGIDLECGCFGSALSARVSGWTIGRNILLTALLFPTLWEQLRNSGRPS